MYLIFFFLFIKRFTIKNKYPATNNMQNTLDNNVQLFRIVHNKLRECKYYIGVKGNNIIYSSKDTDIFLCIERSKNVYTFDSQRSGLRLECM
jgi:hypothetical protein